MMIGKTVQKITDEMKWEIIRNKRNDLLCECDLKAIVLSEQVRLNPDLNAKYISLLSYRQQLRDLPQTYSNVDEVEFPIWNS